MCVRLRSCLPRMAHSGRRRQQTLRHARLTPLDSQTNRHSRGEFPLPNPTSISTAAMRMECDMLVTSGPVHVARYYGSPWGTGTAPERASEGVMQVHGDQSHARGGIRREARWWGRGKQHGGCLLRVCDRHREPNTSEGSRWKWGWPGWCVAGPATQCNSGAGAPLSLFPRTHPPSN